jgi:signal transduction histidine kinase
MDIIQQLLKLVAINTRISSLHSSDEIMAEIMNEAMSLTGTTGAFVLRVSPERELSCLARYRSGAAEPETNWSSSSALEAHDGRHMVYSTRALESSSAPSIVMGSIQTLISSPLSFGPDGTVVLQLVGRDATSIDPQTISLLNLFIGQVQVTTSKSKLEEAARRNAALAATGELAAQVAHDIRSPLAALEAAVDDGAQPPEEKRRLIRAATDRIREIADDLLKKDTAAARRGGAASFQPLAALIEPLVAEKRLRFQSRPGVRIESAIDVAQPLCARVEPAEFRRLLSNLIDNAVEAVGDGPGAVRVILAARDECARISVQDEGKGIPPEVLRKLGRRGETHGKAGGSGLGLYHARTCAESWGGSLELDSEVGAGTTATVVLPLVPASPVGERCDAVLIDDDALTRMNWTLAAKKVGKTLLAFPAVADFLAESDSIDRTMPVYLDSDLGDGVKGEAEAARIHGLGFGEIYLATGHAPEKFAGHVHLRGVTGKNPPWGPPDEKGAK